MVDEDDQITTVDQEVLTETRLSVLTNDDQEQHVNLHEDNDEIQEESSRTSQVRQAERIILK